MQVTSQHPIRSCGSFTPVSRNQPPTNSSAEKDPKSLKRRRALDYLSRIPSPPPLSHLGTLASPCVNKTFNPPRWSGTPGTLQTVRTPAPKSVSPVEDEWVNDEELAMIDTQALLDGDLGKLTVWCKCTTTCKKSCLYDCTSCNLNLWLSSLIKEVKSHSSSKIMASLHAVLNSLLCLSCSMPYKITEEPAAVLVVNLQVATVIFSLLNYLKNNFTYICNKSLNEMVNKMKLLWIQHSCNTVIVWRRTTAQTKRSMFH